MQKRKLIYLESVGICIHYKAKITDGAKIAENFRLDAESLPIDILNLEAYDSLFIKYGTHFVDDIVMGAKSIVRHAFEASALKSLKEKGVHVESSATASFLSITSGGSNKEDTQTKDLKEFESQRESYAALFLGSKPSVDGDWKTWAQTTYMPPFPVRYELKELSTLLVPTFFPNLNATELAYKRILASMALSKYCEKIEGCGEPKLPEEKPEPEIIGMTYYLGSCNITLTYMVGFENIFCVIIILWGNPSHFLIIFVLFKHFTEKTAGVSRIRTRIVGVEGEHSDH